MRDQKEYYYHHCVVHRSVSYVHSITLDTSKDRVVQDFEQLPGKVNGGLGETVYRWPVLCCVVELSVPTEGYNHAVHHVSGGEVTAG